MRKVLVTGGLGFVGSALVPKLLEDGWGVVALDTGWFGNHLSSHANLKVLIGDTRDLVETDLDGVDNVIHLAAIANDPLSDLHPEISWEIGALGSFNLLKICKKIGVKHFIYASSGSVYGIRQEISVTEDSDLTPISLYNKVKMATERIVMSFDSNFKVTILRPATVCGWSPRMRLDLAVNALTFSALSTGKILLHGGDQIRPNIHINDMCDAYLHFLNRDLPSGIYNAGFENLSLAEIAKSVQDVIPSRVEIVDSYDPRSYRLDSQKMLDTGFKPKESVKSAILQLSEAYSKGTLVDRPEWHSTKYLSAIFGS